MDISEKVAAYYEEEHSFKENIAILRELVLKTELEETYKWNFPTYTLNNKNVLSICKFKNHFGIWFFNGVFLTDPKNILEKPLEGKTKGMRRIKYTSNEKINTTTIQSYIFEAIENERKGLKMVPIKNTPETLIIPKLLQEAFEEHPQIKLAFNTITPYKQREYCNHINNAKQEKTKYARLEKIIPLIKQGIGLNDSYRK